MTKSLDLGCGPRPQNPFKADQVYGVDIREDLSANIKKADLALEAIPYNNEFFEYVTAFDFIEHIPRVIYTPERRNAFIEVMNEVYRVLKVGGIFLSLTPAYPHPEAFQDPTHVNIITEDTFRCYFDDKRRWASMYGFKGAFSLVSQEWYGENSAKLFTQLRKVSV
jgi:SAM-dependent methyltransferase